MKHFIFAFLLLTIDKAWCQGTSFTEAGYGLQTSTYINTLLVASPPLPMLFMKPGVNRISLQPGYVEGKLDALSNTGSGSVNTRTRGQVYGGGGAAAFNHAFSESLGFYVLGFGNKVGGEFSVIQESGCSPCTRTDMRDIKSSFVAGGAGLNWTFLGGSPSSIVSAGVFGGPAVTAISMSQQVVKSDGTTVTDDFEMKLSPTFLTALFGLQFAFRIGDWFLINPYLLSNWVFNEQCHTYEVTKTTVSGPLVGRSTSTCGGSTNGSPATTTHQIEMKGDVASIGVNLGFPSMGFSVNVFSMPSVPYSGSVLKELKTNLYVATFSFDL